MTTYTKRMLVLIGLMMVVACVVVWTIRERFFQQDLLTIHEASEKVETLYTGSVESFEKIGETYEMTLERDGKVYKVVVDAKTGDISRLAFVSMTETAGIYKSEKQIRAIVAEQNTGEIQAVAKQETSKGFQYIVDVVQKEGTTTLVLDAKTGEVLSEKRKTSLVATTKEPTPAVNKVTNSSPSTIAVPSVEPSSNNSASTGNTSSNKANPVVPSKETTSTDTNQSKNANTNAAKDSNSSNVIISQGRAIKIAHSQLKGEVDSVIYEKTSDGGYYLIEIDGKQSEAVFQIHAVSGKIMSITRDDQETDNEKDDD